MVLELIQTNFAIFGIARNPTRETQSTILLFFILFGLNLTSLILYLLREPNTFLEYTQSIYFTAIGTMAFVCYPILVLKGNKFFELIDKIEVAIEKAKCKENTQRIFCKLILE